MSQSEKNNITTRSSSINRALDQIGDKWCLLILQEVFWGINTFNEMLDNIGASRGVLTNRLNWLQSVGCLRKQHPDGNSRRPIYHLTKKSIELYDNALMAVVWERKYFTTPVLDEVAFIHQRCGHAFWPELQCQACDEQVACADVSYKPGPGAQRDEREIKTRRRSSKALPEDFDGKALYRNLVELLGDRWTANLIALAFHGLKRFDQFHSELPIATNILTDRLKLLVNEGIFFQQPYQQNPVRYEYHLTDKGGDLYPYFLTLLQWGDKWCGNGSGVPMLLTHINCGRHLKAEVRCNHCGEKLVATEVQINV